MGNEWALEEPSQPGRESGCRGILLANLRSPSSRPVSTTVSICSDLGSRNLGTRTKERTAWGWGFWAPEPGGRTGWDFFSNSAFGGGLRKDRQGVGTRTPFPVVPTEKMLGSRVLAFNAGGGGAGGRGRGRLGQRMRGAGGAAGLSGGGEPIQGSGERRDPAPGAVSGAGPPSPEPARDAAAETRGRRPR